MFLAEQLLGILAFVLTLAIFYCTPELARRRFPCGGDECNQQFWWECKVLLGPGALGAFFTAYFLTPTFAAVSNRFLNRWRPIYSVIILAAACTALGTFILHFGNRQFGGWDFSILIDTGWRQLIGQRPYTDFICTNPPGFNLGLKYAFQLLGASWNSQLYATAIFAGATFLWNYWLLDILVETRPAAFLMALAVECATMLPLDFWWYNNITAVIAAVFFLSCVAYREQPLAAGSQISYVASLALLGLMKPNVTGVLAAGAVFFLFFATQRKKRLTVLTLAATLLTILLLVMNGINIFAMLRSYAAAAIERGGFPKTNLAGVGFRGYAFRSWFFIRIVFCFVALMTPIVFWVPYLWAALKQVNLRDIAYQMLFVIAPIVSIYAMLTNGDLKDVEWAILLAADAVLVFQSFGSPSRLRRFYVAFVCALIVSDLCTGAVRLRVMGIGPYFNSNDSRSRVDSSFFKDLRASTRFHEMVDQIREAVSTSPRPVFFGPRVEFAYAAFRVPSPEHLPLYWTPGTAFAAWQESELLEEWRKHHFRTLIFFKNDFTFYSPQFLQLINDLYSRDDHYSELTVFHARPMFY